MEDEKEIDPWTVNPFALSEGLEFVEVLKRSGSRGPQPLVSQNTFAAKVRSQTTRGETMGEAVLARLADISPQPISWLWPGRIALGKLTLIAGDPGLGKSLLTATIAATVSKGYSWPLGGEAAPIGSVILLSAEDDPADTIRPRMDAAEADCNRIHILQAIRAMDADGDPAERIFSLKRDIFVLEDLLTTLGDCRLLIIDPISAYLEGADSHNNTDVRGLLAPLAKLAADHSIAIIMVQHLNKNSAGSAMSRSIGSIAFVAASRAAYIVTKDQNDPERRLVMPVKNNLAKDSTGLAYSVHTADNDAPVIAWETEPVMMTADEALTPSDSDDEKSETDWALSFLEDELAGGSKTVKDVNTAAHSAGIKNKALRRARTRLGVIPKKSGFHGGWVWSLPGHEDAQEVEDAHSKIEGVFGDEGHLGNEETKFYD